jgi:UDP-N-acetylmuramate: L-alanyl-gamma-D-glutamyl-meso-diaminopimelate ligase
MNIHLCAICGMGMGSLAQLLRESGHRVGGSDAGPYPPMSDLLARLGVEIKTGFSPAHIPPDTELVIVGNAVRADNPEVQETIRRGLRYLSFPAALEEMYLSRRTNVVVAGTHGKTTTSSLIAWILTRAGLEPGFLIGGVLRNFDSSSASGRGPHFVVEGDEYHTAFFDRNPKFLHYRPSIGVLTSVDFDHADIFSGLDACKETFRQFAALVPSSGTLVACADDPHVRGIAADAPSASVETYGFLEGADWRLSDFEATAAGARFTLARRGSVAHRVESPLAGAHNARNAAAAFAAASALGVPPDRILQGIASFRGVKRRQEVRGEARGVTVIDDFAHHPTEVRETIEALKGRYAGRRIWAVWEPRTNSSRRSFFQNEYPEAFLGADRVVVAGVFRAEQIEEGRRFSPRRLAADLSARGVHARCIERVDKILAALLAECVPGDIVLIMSNGSFEDLHERLLAGLRG